MDRRLALCLSALAVAACGDAFTEASDGGVLPGVDGSFDASIDTGVRDAAGDDGSPARDAESRDVVVVDEGGGEGDGGVTKLDAGGTIDAGVCLQKCPLNFDCLESKCEDRAALHFGLVSPSPQSNWTYGSFMSFGSSNFVPYVATWSTNGIVFSSQAKGVLTSSVFHALMSASYAGMAIPAGTLGIYPGAAANLDSVVRWTAPVAGHYAIDATFTGLGTSPPTTAGVSVNIGPANVIGKSIDGAIPSVTYAKADQLMAAGDTIDFYVNAAAGGVTMSADGGAAATQGGTGLDARITAN
jgi:hypothetical protein